MRIDSALAVLCVAGGLMACSPTYNWRQVRFESPGLEALLPCKPDHGSRPASLAGRSFALSMQGCEVQGATFAIAWADTGDAPHAAEVMAAWKAATLANLRAAPAGQARFVPPGALDLAQSVQVSVRGTQESGAPLAARAAWFARGGHVFQALVVGPHVDAEAADTFLAGLRLGPA